MHTKRRNRQVQESQSQTHRFVESNKVEPRKQIGQKRERHTLSAREIPESSKPKTGPSKSK